MHNKSLLDEIRLYRQNPCHVKDDFSSVLVCFCSILFWQKIVSPVQDVSVARVIVSLGKKTLLHLHLKNRKWYMQYLIKYYFSIFQSCDITPKVSLLKARACSHEWSCYKEILLIKNHFRSDLVERKLTSQSASLFVLFYILITLVYFFLVHSFAHFKCKSSCHFWFIYLLYYNLCMIAIYVWEVALLKLSGFWQVWDNHHN